jgi:hypothetical protein
LIPARMRVIANTTVRTGVVIAGSYLLLQEDTRIYKELEEYGQRLLSSLKLSLVPNTTVLEVCVSFSN